MEAQSLLSQFPSNSTKPLLQTPRESFSVNFSKSQKLDSLKTRYCVKLASQRVRAEKRLVCRNSVGRDVLSPQEEEDSLIRVQRKKLAVFVSGGGSNFRSIHEAAVRGSVYGCGGAEHARNNGIPVIVFPKTSNVPEGLSSTDLVAALRRYEVDFILLAGYLKLIPVELIRAYQRSILNIHPSLLPAFGGKGYYGMKVHRAVIASGARYSGPTIHFVDEHYDTGRILAQRVVPVLANDTAEELAARVLHEEHRLYVEVTEALCEDRIVWREDGVPIIRSRENPKEYC
ncbi:Formyl transferase [Macleaya cordata]|uniref:Phosphoribosylglycinamide formyltransferase, chloroplastic n=1 Tax=Macleaya cordata TaxID=56857 RepID=A0A200RBE0_MACCD|nr:Formyl transferase [Macleaya cordata]